MDSLISTLVSLVKISILAVVLFCGACWIHHYNLDAKGLDWSKKAFVASFPPGTFK